MEQESLLRRGERTELGLICPYCDARRSHKPDEMAPRGDGRMALAYKCQSCKARFIWYDD